MPNLRPPIVLLVAALLALGASACGSDKASPDGGATTSVPADSESGVVDAIAVPYAFLDGALAPAQTRVAAASAKKIKLSAASKDGRPIALVIRIGSQRIRLVAAPGATQSRTIPMPPKGRYRVVPDGAAEPAVLIIE